MNRDVRADGEVYPVVLRERIVNSLCMSLNRYPNISNRGIVEGSVRSGFQRFYRCLRMYAGVCNKRTRKE